MRSARVVHWQVLVVGVARRKCERHNGIASLRFVIGALRRQLPSAHNLTRTYGNEPTVPEEAERDQWEAVIGWGEEEGNPLKARLDLAVKVIEETCRPLIEERHNTRRIGFL